MMRVAIVCGKQKKSFRGQGVVEYVGAMVIAVAVVLAGLLVAPPSFNNLMTTIFASVTTLFTAALGF
ncbi:hypothetical protein [Vampirovibrio chlorellavorus]|uniref:hypothetical protein n=1 Tax=Vampirovibrio chlorellavorus TaxID=758823 RepID=UPI0026F023D8|nr:hypothetical protein [Vampirovibrio chlorellavorus]